MALLTENAPPFLSWTWTDLESRYADLQARSITAETVNQFLLDWSNLTAQVAEIGARLYAATTQNTADEEAQQRYQTFLAEIFPKVQEAEQVLREHLLASNLTPEGYELSIKRMRTEAELFWPENVPLQAEEAKLDQEYLSLTGNQTVEWEGKTVSLRQLSNVLAEPDRAQRERAWRLMAERRAQDREAIDTLWQQLLELRQREARNAGFESYIPYRWQQLKRYDYTPDDAQRFVQAVETVVVPVIARMNERRRRSLGVDTLRPWDTRADVQGLPALRPFQTTDEFLAGMSRIFHQVHPDLGIYFDTMQREGYLDVDQRLNKAPVGYMTPLPASGRPFIFFESSGQRLDVETLLHEGGHAFHVFETSHLPLLQGNILEVPMEFAEVGSMAMEFLGEPYLGKEQGGFYSPRDVARARLDHMEQRVLSLWGSIAQGEAFQQWVYAHPEEAMHPERLDVIWADLTRRFQPGIDWTGLEAEQGAGWRTIPHFFGAPFYYIEYGMAQLGAVQIAANARRDQEEAVRRYRDALGATRSLPELFSTAGGRFAFDEETFRWAVNFLEETIAELEPAAMAE